MVLKPLVIQSNMLGCHSDSFAPLIHLGEMHRVSKSPSQANNAGRCTNAPTIYDRYAPSCSHLKNVRAVFSSTCKYIGLWITDLQPVRFHHVGVVWLLCVNDTKSSEYCLKPRPEAWQRTAFGPLGWAFYRLQSRLFLLPGRNDKWMLLHDYKWEILI